MSDSAEEPQVAIRNILSEDKMSLSIEVTFFNGDTRILSYEEAHQLGFMLMMNHCELEGK